MAAQLVEQFSATATHRRCHTDDLWDQNILGPHCDSNIAFPTHGCRKNCKEMLLRKLKLTIYLNNCFECQYKLNIRPLYEAICRLGTEKLFLLVTSSSTLDFKLYK